MKTAGIFAEAFKERTAGRRATFTVNALTLDAVKVVLNGVQLATGTDGAEDDERAGYIRRDNKTGYYGGRDGYKPTAKGFRAILKELETA